MSIATLEKVMAVILMKVVAVALSYNDSYSASESGDDSVLSVSHSISSRTQGKNHDSSCSTEHGVHSTASRDSSRSSRKSIVERTSVRTKASSSVSSSRDTLGNTNQSATW